MIIISNNKFINKKIYIHILYYINRFLYSLLIHQFPFFINRFFTFQFHHYCLIGDKNTLSKVINIYYLNYCFSVSYYYTNYFIIIEFYHCCCLKIPIIYLSYDIIFKEIFRYCLNLYDLGYFLFSKSYLHLIIQVMFIDFMD